MASIFGYFPGIFDDLKWLLAFIFGVMIAFWVANLVLNKLFPRPHTKKELKLRVVPGFEDEDEDEDEEYWGP